MDAPMRREMTPVMKMEDFILMIEVEDEICVEEGMVRMFWCKMELRRCLVSD